MKRLLIMALILVGCGSSSGGESPVPLYPFTCSHEAVLCALAIEPYCGPEPVIVVGFVEELDMMHAAAYCDGLGWVRIVGTRAVGVYPDPGLVMINQKTYTVGDYMSYTFGWAK